MKTKVLKQLPVLAIIFAFMAIYSACASTIAPYSQYAYQMATSLKVEALTLMDRAVEPYSQHEAEVGHLISDVEKAYEYARGIPKNSLTSKQWEILKTPDKNLLAGFMKRWQEKGQLTAPFINEAKGLVSDAFDTIIGFESQKIKL